MGSQKDFHGSRAKIIFHEHVGDTWLFALSPGTRKNPVCWLRVDRLFLPLANETREQGHHWRWSFARFTLWLTNFPARPFAADVNLLVFVINICPVEAQAFAALNVHDHALVIDVADLQARELGAPHAGPVERHQNGAIEGSRRSIDELRDFFLTENRFLGLSDWKNQDADITHAAASAAPAASF